MNDTPRLDENVYLSYHSRADVYGFVLDATESRQALPLVSPRASASSDRASGRGLALGRKSAAVSIVQVDFDGANIENASCELAPPGALVVFAGATAIRTRDGYLDLNDGKIDPRPRDYQFHVSSWRLVVSQENADFAFDISV